MAIHTAEKPVDGILAAETQSVDIGFYLERFFLFFLCPFAPLVFGAVGGG